MCCRNDAPVAAPIVHCGNLPVERATAKAGLSPSVGIVSTAWESTPSDVTVKDCTAPLRYFRLSHCIIRSMKITRISSCEDGYSLQDAFVGRVRRYPRRIGTRWIFACQ